MLYLYIDVALAFAYPPTNENSKGNSKGNSNSNSNRNSNSNWQ